MAVTLQVGDVFIDLVIVCCNIKVDEEALLCAASGGTTMTEGIS